MSQQMQRHLGKIKNTGKNCVVVFMQIPGAEDHALVVDTDALPERLHEDLMRVVEREGQHETNLYETLARKLSTDDSRSILEVLHNRGRLERIPIDNVILHPMPGYGYPLEEVIKNMKSQSQEPQQTFSSNQDVKQQQLNEQVLDQEQPTQTMSEAIQQERQAVETDAESLIRQAEMLEADATAKREEAYKLNPSLKPKAKNSSAKTKTKQSEGKKSTKTSKTSSELDNQSND